jgi:hypothetical protein
MGVCEGVSGAGGDSDRDDDHGGSVLVVVRFVP